MKNIFKKIYNLVFEGPQKPFILDKSDAASLVVGKCDINRFTGSIILKDKGSLHLEDDCFLRNASITILDNAKVIIGNNCLIENAQITARGNSEIYIDAFSSINPPANYPSVFQVNNGFVHIHKYSIIQASSILVDFGGQLKIGEYSGIGYNSEIRCHEKIEIGKYALFSYDLCIYDTNTHSLDYQQRRERKHFGHPRRHGVFELEKPNTSPIIIGDDVWLGKGVTITKGAMIGDRCIVGIRTVVGAGVYEPDSIIVTDKPRVIKRSNND